MLCRQAGPGLFHWPIPLASHLGLGYVYNSQFNSDEAASEELRQYVQLNPGAEQKPRFL